jgi:hypothetical protein
MASHFLFAPSVLLLRRFRNHGGSGMLAPWLARQMVELQANDKQVMKPISGKLYNMHFAIVGPQCAKSPLQIQPV